MNDNVVHLRSPANEPSPMLKQLFSGTVWLIDEGDQAFLAAANALLAAGLMKMRVKDAHAKQDLAAMRDAARRYATELEKAKLKTGEAFVMAVTLHAETVRHIELGGGQ